MKKNRTMIGTMIAVILIILLLNPQWLPVSMETKEKIHDLEKSYFLIERSGRITAAHILTLLLMISVLWVINVVVKAWSGDWRYWASIQLLCWRVSELWD